jgi:hypothetical protein
MFGVKKSNNCVIKKNNDYFYKTHCQKRDDFNDKHDQDRKCPEKMNFVV